MTPVRGPMGEAVESASRDDARGAEAPPTAPLADAREHPPSGFFVRAAGIVLGYLKRVVPKSLRPRLGSGDDQYAARPLMVPAAYLRVRPPHPAPTISVVTPIGGHNPYLERTLQSVTGQGYPELQHIVVHDGSNRETAAILNGNRPPLRSLQLSPDRGQAGAINAGFASSRGEVMAWLNSDDVLLPGALAYVGRYFAAHPEVDVVYGHCVFLDAHDRDVGLWVTPRHCTDSLRWLDFLPQETVFWRRRVWDAVGGIDESLTLAFDWDLFSRFHRSGATIVRLPRFLGGFRQHPAQRMRVQRVTALAEQALIRERWHGRPVTGDELRARLFPYLLRSLPYFGWYRTRLRLPGRRVEVFAAKPSELSDEIGSETQWSA
jgi:glycosyltransferase involved in cell wall biosynthesis